MLPLIRKEIINIYSWTFIISLVFIMITLLFSKRSDPAILILVLTYLFAYKNVENDRKVNMDVILNSLPVSRLQIIVVKYISLYLYFLIAFFLCMFLTRVATFLSTNALLHKVDYDITLFLGTLVFWSFYMAIYVPISVLIHSQVVQYVLGFLFMLVVPMLINPTVIEKMLEGEISLFSRLIKLDLLYLILAVVITLIINVISSFFLYSIYRKKDLF